MQDSEYLEQLRQELVELSPDFAHDEKSIKNLIQHMLTHKIKVEQDKHFKDQLADRLSRHIAWSKESHDIDPKVQARTSRLGRFIAYGLPGLAVLALIIVTLPPLLDTPLSQDPISIQSDKITDSVGDETIIRLSTDSLSPAYRKTTPMQQDIISQDKNGSADVSSVSVRKQDMDMELMMIPTQPMIQTSGVEGNRYVMLSGDESISFSGVNNEISGMNGGIYQSGTLSERGSYVKSLEDEIGYEIILQEDTILACNIRETIVYCTVLYQWPLTLEHKEQLKKEIIYTIPSAKIE